MLACRGARARHADAARQTTGSRRMTKPLADIEGRLASILPRLQKIALGGSPAVVRGRVRRLLGTIVHATVADVRIGEICHLVDPVTGQRVAAEVIGFTEEMAVLTPVGDLSGLSSGAEVMPSGD